MQLPFPPAHPLARINYRVRTGSFAYSFLVVCALFLERGFAVPVLVLAALSFLVYPQLAYLHARVALDSRQAELHNLVADSVLLGVWIAQLHFALMPGLGALVAINLNNAVCGGTRRLLAGMLVFALAALAWGAVQDFRIIAATGALVTAMCALGIVG